LYFYLCVKVTKIYYCYCYHRFKRYTMALLCVL